MTEQVHHQPRAPVPQKLEQTETLQSLSHLEECIYQFLLLMSVLRVLPNTGINWNNTENRGFTRETRGLKRTEQTLAADLEGFLSCLARYLPFDYAVKKLFDESTSMNSVWEIIYEIYGAEVNTVNFLDYASMQQVYNCRGNCGKVLFLRRGFE